MEILEYLALVVVLVIVGVGILIATTLMGRQSIPDGLEINGLRIVKDGIVSICVFPLAGGDVVLFDAGNDKRGKAILGELSRLELGRENVKTIFLTHGHRDIWLECRCFPTRKSWHCPRRWTCRRTGIPRRPDHADDTRQADRRKDQPRPPRWGSSGSGDREGAGLRRPGAYGRQRSLSGERRPHARRRR